MVESVAVFTAAAELVSRACAHCQAAPISTPSSADKRGPGGFAVPSDPTCQTCTSTASHENQLHGFVTAERGVVGGAEASETGTVPTRGRRSAFASFSLPGAHASRLSHQSRLRPPGPTISRRLR
jgi:hypothetical protein